jgi:putative membrane protein
MTRKGLLALACSAALTAACGADNDADRTAANPPAAEAPAATGGAMGTSPAEWLQDAAEKNAAEVQLGQLAAERAQDPQVKKFAQAMIDEHTKALDELKQLASTANVQLSNAINDDHRDLHERLAKLSGAEFDRGYIDAMVEEHGDTLEMLQDKADDANEARPTGTSGPASSDDAKDAERDRINRDLGQWASKTAPKVQEHLETARQIQQKIDK